MSKPVKSLILDMYKKQFASTKEAALIDLRGVRSNDTTTLRQGLAKKQIRVTMLKNNLARKTFGDGPLSPLNDLITGPTALVHGGESVVSIARELLDWAKKVEKMQFKGAVLEGIVFGPAQIKDLSKYPTKPEAQAQVVGQILGPARKLASQIKGPGAKIAGIIKTIEEKLEKGEAIAKVA
jgi:large subunit ribosomal protein L10